MTSRRTSIILVTMMLAAACTGCDRSGARGRAAYDDPSLPSGGADFKHANSLIDRPTWGREKAFGNTEEAKKLALRFGEMLEAMQEIVLEKGIFGGSVKNGVRTYCELSDDTVVFLVYVPEFRKYTNKAQETMVDLGWTLAKGSVSSIRKDKDLDRLQVVVGFRGVLLYGAAGMGPASGEKPSRKYVNGAVPEDTFYRSSGARWEPTPAEPPPGPKRLAHRWRR